MKTVKIYDTTLRDGTQAEEISLSVEDKILVSKKLDELGIHYIEGGWPGSNPKDVQFFKEIKKAFKTVERKRTSTGTDRFWFYENLLFEDDSAF